jgi:hypothetical protein
MERRGSARYRTDITATVVLDDGRVRLSALMKNLSDTGAKVRLPANAGMSGDFYMLIPSHRLQQIFELLDKPARGKTCEAILGIIEEGKTIMDEFKGTQALDAGLISAAQAVEHYEIARYGTLKTWAGQLGLREATKLLDQTLSEEEATDKKLTQLATSEANRKAA